MVCGKAESKASRFGGARLCHARGAQARAASLTSGWHFFLSGLVECLDFLLVLPPFNVLYQLPGPMQPNVARLAILFIIITFGPDVGYNAHSNGQSERSAPSGDMVAIAISEEIWWRAFTWAQQGSQ